MHRGIHCILPRRQRRSPTAESRRLPLSILLPLHGIRGAASQDQEPLELVLHGLEGGCHCRPGANRLLSHAGRFRMCCQLTLEARRVSCVASAAELRPWPRPPTPRCFRHRGGDGRVGSLYSLGVARERYTNDVGLETGTLEYRGAGKVVCRGAGKVCGARRS